MNVKTLVPLAALLALSACEVPSPAQRKMLDSMIGKSETDLVRSLGVPTRNFNTGGHTFLAYVDNESSYSPGSPGVGWGWGWGGWGWGGGGFGGGYGGGFGGGGYGGGFGGPWGGGYGGGFGPSYYQSSCTTTFEVDAGRVASWNVRGDGC
ncbi:MAG: hypothetical protein ACRYGI_02040 [Janthinobacterium lividum]